MRAVPPLSPLAGRVAAALGLPRGTPVLAACSGGADSLALLLLLAEAARHGVVGLTCAHVHHGLREGDADADLDRVRHAAEALGVPFLAHHVDTLAALAARRQGLEDAARAVRLEALEAMRCEAGALAVALAHTADDQAETVLLRLLRGGSLASLAGLARKSGHLLRPLLGVRRLELEGVLAGAALPWASDPTNWGKGSARGLVRGLTARLEDVLDHRLVEHLCRLADEVRADGEILDAEAARLFAAACGAVESPDGLRWMEMRCDAEELVRAPLPLRRRVVRSLLAAARRDGRPPTSEALTRALALAEPTSPAGQAAHLSGVVVSRSGARLVAHPPTGPSGTGHATLLEIPGTVEWPGAGSIRALDRPRGATESEPLPMTGEIIVMDRDRIALPLVVRAARPGDRLELPTGPWPRRVSTYLRERGVPAGARRAHPVVVGDAGAGPLLWVAGHDVTASARPGPDTTRLVVLEWRRTHLGEPRQ